MEKENIGDSGSKLLYLFISIIVIFLLIGLLLFNYKDTLSGYKILSSKNEIIKIGIIKWNTNSEFDRNIRGFKDSLTEAGYVEGQNVRYIEGFSNSDRNKHLEIARGFTNNKKVDLIYSLTTPGTLMVKTVTDKIPIVFSVVNYPVESEIINSLEDSGNNLVGTRNYIPVSEQFSVFESVYPNIKTLGFAHRNGEPNSEIQLREFKNILDKRNIKIIDMGAIDTDGLVVNLQDKINEADAIYLACDTLISSGGDKAIIEFNRNKGYNKPIFSCNKDGIIAGALIGNVADFYDLGKISGEKAVLILKGAEPSWLLTESSRKRGIVINIKTAAEIKISIPEDILNNADKVES